MTDREKLIELIDGALEHASKQCEELDSCCACPHGDRGGCQSAFILDYLITNGVTFATDTNVPSKLFGNSEQFKWISVEDRLPEPGVVVLVYSKLGCTYFSYILRYHLEGRPFAIEYSGGWEITHWMPMPLPPKEEPK